MKFFKSLVTTVLAVVSLAGFAGGQSDARRVVKQIEIVLCPDGKPLGKAANEVDIREVKVKDFSDAYAYMLRMCPQQEIKEGENGRCFYYTLPDGKGKLVLTDKVKAGTKEVAVLEVEIESLRGKVRQVRFTK